MTLTPSCKTQKASSSQSYTARIDSLIRWRVDSIHWHTADTLKLWSKGDTVFNESIHWRVKYRDRFVADTVIKMDTVRTATTTVVTEAKMSGFQKVFFYIGLIGIILLIFYLAFKIFW